MGLDGFKNLLGKKPAKQYPRRDARYPTENLSCPLGDVVDLSASGMRIRCDARPAVRRGATDSFAIRTGSQKLVVLGRVVWVRRKSLLEKKYEVGVSFTDPRPGVRKVLSDLAQYGFVGAGGGSCGSPAGTGGGDRRKVSAEVQVEDLYSVLGLTPTATEDQIKAAYRALARELHPDVCKDPAGQERFVLVTKAYNVLRDPKERQRYDDLVARLSSAA
jgi:hypothetical protein